MARFKEGQELVCHKKGDWLNLNGNVTKFAHPKFNEIVTCAGYKPTNPTFLYLKEYYIPGHDNGIIAFNELEFSPVMNISELTEILEQEPATA